MKYLVKNNESGQQVTLMIIEDMKIKVSDENTLDQLFTFTSKDHAIANLQSMAQQLVEAGMTLEVL